MTLTEYINAILPLIRASKRFPQSDSYAAHTIQYLYRQAFYGFQKYGECMVSERAITEYKNLGYQDDIREKTVNDQPQFEPCGYRSGTKGAIFHLEHIFTGTMFRRKINNIGEEERTVDKIEQIVKENYVTAWITKDEDKLLTAKGYRTNRPENPMEAYEKVGIKLFGSNCS